MIHAPELLFDEYFDESVAVLHKIDTCIGGDALAVALDVDGAYIFAVGGIERDLLSCKAGDDDFAGAAVHAAEVRQIVNTERIDDCLVGAGTFGDSFRSVDVGSHEVDSVVVAAVLVREGVALDVVLKYITSERGQQEIARALLAAVKEYAAYVESTCLHEEGAPSAPAVREECPEPVDRPAAAPEPQPGKPAAAPKSESGYTIQLLASATKIPARSAELKSYRGKAKEYDSAGRYRYKYCYGSYPSRAAAAADLAAVRKVFRDAYVVRYNGDRIE